MFRGTGVSAGLLRPGASDTPGPVCMFFGFLKFCGSEKIAIVCKILKCALCPPLALHARHAHAIALSLSSLSSFHDLSAPSILVSLLPLLEKNERLLSCILCNLQNFEQCRFPQKKLRGGGTWQLAAAARAESGWAVET